MPAQYILFVNLKVSDEKILKKHLRNKTNDMETLSYYIGNFEKIKNTSLHINTDFQSVVETKKVHTLEIENIKSVSKTVRGFNLWIILHGFDRII